jgi:hypothetical protein
MPEPDRLDYPVLLRNASLVLRQNLTMLVPTMAGVIASIILAELVLAPVMPYLMDPALAEEIPTELLQRLKIFLFAMLVIWAYAHGVTAAMAREALETGHTDLRTARMIAWKALPSLLPSALLIGGSVTLGLLMLALPGVFAALVTMFVMAAIVVHSLDPFDALRTSYMIVRENLRESVMLFFSLLSGYLMLSIFTFVLGFIPLLGIFVGLILTGGYGAMAALIIVQAYKKFTGLMPLVLRIHEPTPTGHE